MAPDKQYEVIVIGTGFSGIAAAKSLQRHGIEDFVMLERRSFVGGTWSQNTYPGAAVDVPSPLYSLSHEPYDWSQFYCDQDELKSYTEAVIERNGLDKKIIVEANVEGLEWKNCSSEWHVHVSGKGTWVASTVIVATGLLSQPVIPNFPGKDRFRGESFHTNHWDSSYDYRGKRVAVIGTGASAVQLIPAIAPDVEHLAVFQRTPTWVLPRMNFRFSSRQRRLMRLPGVYTGIRGLVYSFTELAMVGYKVSRKFLDATLGRSAKTLLDEQVKDPALKRKLTPSYAIGCKQIAISSEYYPALCRNNVTLHDRSNRIQAITERGILCESGEELEIDLIVYATGFNATDGVIPFEVKGRAGKTLTDAWSDFPRAYLGTTVPDFPNLFFTTGPNTGSAHTSALFLIESQLIYIMNCLEAKRLRGFSAIAVQPSAEKEYTSAIHREMTKTVWHAGGCSSWHESGSGKVTVIYPGFSFNFRRSTKKFRSEHHIYG